MNHDLLHVRISRVLTLLATVVSLFAGCKEKIADNPAGNELPRSFLWLYPGSSLDTVVSRQHLHWWGEDPDGFVRGFLFAFDSSRMTRLPSPDTLRYTWMTKNDTVIQFPLRSLRKDFTVFVRSVDNTFSGLPNNSQVRYLPGPNGQPGRFYVDNNGNGTADPGDQQLPGLQGAIDPVGAIQTFPIRNTPPSITFLSNPNDLTSPTLRLPDTTYTVVSIGFKGSDPDGDNTLSSYRVALNDASNLNNWLQIPLRDTVVTLVVPRARSDARTVPGDTVTADVYGGSFLGRHLLGHVRGLRLDAPNVVYVEVKDVAGEYSAPIRLPSLTGQWYVKRPRGKLLLVQDYTGHFDVAAALSTYLTSLGNVVPPISVDALNIGFGVNAVDKRSGKISTMVPPFIDPAVINTFLLYDYVFIYTDEYPTFSVLQLVPFRYIQNGGKLLLSTYGFSSDLSQFDVTTVLREFAPIDSVCATVLSPPPPAPVPGYRFVYPDYLILPDSSNSANIYPLLAVNSSTGTHNVFMRELYTRTDARAIYRLQSDPFRRYTSVDPSGRGDTVGTKIAVVDGVGTQVFFGLPLHLLNNIGQGQGLSALFTKIFTQHFSKFHKVDRRRF
jgi:hypothetical protein